MKTLYKILSLIMIGFIFSQSLLNASQSGAASGFFVNILNSMLQYVHINININTLSLIIRKFAHFFEFFILGFFLIKGFDYKVIYLLIVVLIVAITDETIQLFSDGRAFQTTDILIDFLGGSLGVYLFKKRK